MIDENCSEFKREIDNNKKDEKIVLNSYSEQKNLYNFIGEIWFQW